MATSVKAQSSDLVSRLSQIKQELLSRLPRTLPDSTQVLACGRLLLEVQEGGLFRLEEYQGVEDWATGVLNLKGRQAGKYITVAKLLSDEEVCGKTLGIEKLYQVALRKMGKGNSGKAKQATDKGGTLARALTSQAGKLERLLIEGEPLSQQSIEETLIAISRLAQLKDRLEGMIAEEAQPPAEPDPVLTEEEIGELYKEVIAPVAAQTEEDKAPLIETLKRIGAGYGTAGRYKEVLEAFLKGAGQRPSKNVYEQATALVTNLRAAHPDGATFAARLAQVLSAEADPP